MAQVGEIVDTFSGVPPSRTTVSRIFHSLDNEYETWKKRSLKAHFLYVFADGTYFTMIHYDVGCKMPVLAVIGIDEAGHREVLTFSVSDRENQTAWEDLLGNLKDRVALKINL